MTDDVGTPPSRGTARDEHVECGWSLPWSRPCSWSRWPSGCSGLTTPSPSPPVPRRRRHPRPAPRRRRRRVNPRPRRSSHRPGSRSRAWPATSRCSPSRATAATCHPFRLSPRPASTRWRGTARQESSPAHRRAMCCSTRTRGRMARRSGTSCSTTSRRAIESSSGATAPRCATRSTKRIEVLDADGYPPYYEREGPPQIAIIVCSGRRLGPGHWTHRTIWFAKPVQA